MEHRPADGSGQMVSGRGGSVRDADQASPQGDGDQSGQTVVVISQDDPPSGVVATVCQALGATAWPRSPEDADRSAKLVAVVEDRRDVLNLIDTVRLAGRRPDLVVAWDIPEFWAAQLLVERLPVVDPTALEAPGELLDHLAGGWSDEELAEELAVAEALNVLEEHTEGVRR
jgi:hypothetical protein